jgi:hypothetical protein
LVRYIHLTPVRAGLAKTTGTLSLQRTCELPSKRNAENHRSSTILKLLGGKKKYENFVLEGMSESHNDEYYTVEDQRFLGEEGFGEEISREAGVIEERKPKKSIETAFKEIARQLEATPDVLGVGRFQQSGPKR